MGSEGSTERPKQETKRPEKNEKPSQRVNFAPISSINKKRGAEVRLWDFHRLFWC